MKRAVNAVVAAVKHVVAKLVALVTFESAAKGAVCSKVVCIKAAKKARTATKRTKAAKKSKN